MKALSLTQPWATLIAIGAKRVETRRWRTHYVGPLAIHASQRFPPDCRALCYTQPFLRALMAGGVNHLGELLLGRIVAVVRLAYCGPTEQADVGADERAFGNYAPGRDAWFLHDVVRLERPVACHGALGLWAVPPDVARAIGAQIGRAA